MHWNDLIIYFSSFGRIELVNKFTNQKNKIVVL